LTVLKITLLFKLKAPFHVSGDIVFFGVDRATYRLAREDRPLAVPASTLKGILRHRAEYVLRTVGQKVCEGSDPAGMCESNPCLVCQVFGSPRYRSPLRFYDSSIEGMADVRMGTGIERRRRTIKQDLLFSYEIGYGRMLRAEITGVFPTRDEAMKACALVYMGAKASLSLGHGGSKGLGWIDVEDFASQLDGKPVPGEQVIEWVREVLKA